MKILEKYIMTSSKHGDMPPVTAVQSKGGTYPSLLVEKIRPFHGPLLGFHTLFCGLPDYS